MIKNSVLKTQSILKSWIKTKKSKSVKQFTREHRSKILINCDHHTTMGGAFNIIEEGKSESRLKSRTNCGPVGAVVGHQCFHSAKGGAGVYGATTSDYYHKDGEMLFGQDPNCDEEKTVMNTTVQLTTTSDYYHKDGEMLLIMLTAGKMMAIQEFFTVKTVPNN